MGSDLLRVYRLRESSWLPESPNQLVVGTLSLNIALIHDPNLLRVYGLGESSELP